MNNKKTTKAFRVSDGFMEKFDASIRFKNSIASYNGRRKITESEMIEEMANYYYDHVCNIDNVKAAEAQHEKYQTGIVTKVLGVYFNNLNVTFNGMVEKLERIVLYLRIIIEDMDLLGKTREQSNTQLISNMIADEDMYQKIRGDFNARYYREAVGLQTSSSSQDQDEDNLDDDDQKDDSVDEKRSSFNYF